MDLFLPLKLLHIASAIVAVGVYPLTAAGLAWSRWPSWE
jgi:hypothetical protein